MQKKREKNKRNQRMKIKNKIKFSCSFTHANFKILSRVEWWWWFRIFVLHFIGSIHQFKITIQDTAFKIRGGGVGGGSANESYFACKNNGN